jgi:hypothetical protein
MSPWSAFLESPVFSDGNDGVIESLQSIQVRQSN